MLSVNEKYNIVQTNWIINDDFKSKIIIWNDGSKIIC